MRHQPAVRRLLAVSFLWLGCILAALAGGTPDAVTPDGGRYYGPLVNGKLHGHGRMEWDNGAFYEGGFANGLMSGKGRFQFANGSLYEGELRDGMMAGRGRLEVPEREVYEGEFKQDYYWGKGEMRSPDGRAYRGEFVRGEYQGDGRLEMPNGDVYEGRFAKGELVHGRHVRKDGAQYEGEFRNWLFHGKGRYTDNQGATWEGPFVDGRLEGAGKAAGKDGRYVGDFKDWRFHGHGVLRLANGDVYDGAFAFGLYEGQGTLTYAKPRPDGRKQDSGIWHYGMLPQEADYKKAKADVEVALYAQKDLLDKAIASLEPREPGKINLYLLAIAGDGSQEVFRREVDFVQGEFGRRFGTSGRSIALVNSRNTASSVPMATATSIRRSLEGIAARMDREEDILFLFLTSHGSADHRLSLNQDGMQLPDLPAAQLGALLKETGIRWKVIVVSACYSGGFIEPLQDGRTLVITAARGDRRSFGCADENDFTYFGRAFFKEALPRSRSFQEAFRKAEALVKEWEAKDIAGTAAASNASAKLIEENHSLPQISSAGAIDAHLKRWWAQDHK